MATLYFTAWESAAEVALGDPIQETSFSFTGTSAQSSAISGTDNRRRRIRIYSDANCFVTWGENPTASSSDGRAMGADNPEYFDIKSEHKIAAITR